MPLIAERKCVESEIILTLQGQYGDVELGTPGGGMKGKLIGKRLEVTQMEQKEERNNEQQGVEMEVNLPPYWNIPVLFRKEEEKELEGIVAVYRSNKTKAIEILSTNHREDDNDNPEEISSTNHREDDDDNPEVSLYSDRAYKHFMEMLDASKDFSSPSKPEDVNTLILEGLFAKYGDISVESNLSDQVKICFIYQLCWTLQNMRKTRIIDISERQLASWWNSLRILQVAGLKVWFAVDRLEKVTRAYFGLQVRKKFDNTMAEIDRDMTLISKEIEELKRKFEGTKKEA